MLNTSWTSSLRVRRNGKITSTRVGHYLEEHWLMLKIGKYARANTVVVTDHFY